MALALGLALAVRIDLRTRRIPNELTAAMTGIGIGLAATGYSSVTVAGCFAGFLIGLLVMLPGHAMGATGAGDVKLMAAVGALVGPGLVLSAFLFTSLAGGVLAIAVAVRRQRLAETVAGTGRLITAPSHAQHVLKGAAPASRFAYGPAIAIGSLVAVLIA